MRDTVERWVLYTHNLLYVVIGARECGKEKNIGLLEFQSHPLVASDIACPGLDSHRRFARLGLRQNQNL